MGLFSTSSPFDADVERATDENNTTDEWGRIMDICDKVGTSSANAKDCLRSIVKRLNNPDPHIVMQAITLLDACASNCGKNFLLEVASRDFETEIRRLLARSQPKVNERLRLLLRKWADGEFKTDPQLSLIPALVVKLRQEGLDFANLSESKPIKQEPLSKDPNVVSSQQEQDDIAKAIELSLKENPHSPKGPTSLYPSTSLGATAAPTSSRVVEARKVRALYDFEAVEDNELTFSAGDIIHVLDDSDPNWWKGSNYKGEGLFPSNFVTADLSAEPEQYKLESTPRKNVQFNETVTVKTEPREVEIDELQIDRLQHMLDEADPTGERPDPDEMLAAEEQVNAMGPLIDAELEAVDRRHAQLTQLSASLVQAVNLYHTLMREPTFPPKALPPHFAYQPQQQQQPPMFNGLYGGPQYAMPEQFPGQQQYHMGPPPRMEDPRMPQTQPQGPGGYPPPPQGIPNYGTPPQFPSMGPGQGPPIQGPPIQGSPHQGPPLQGTALQGPPVQGTGTLLHYSPSGRLL